MPLGLTSPRNSIILINSVTWRDSQAIPGTTDQRLIKENLPPIDARIRMNWIRTINNNELQLSERVSGPLSGQDGTEHVPVDVYQT